MQFKIIDDDEDIQFQEISTEKTSSIRVNTVESTDTYTTLKSVTCPRFMFLDPEKVENSRVFSKLLYELFQRKCLTFMVNPDKLTPESEMFRYLTDSIVVR